MLQSIAEEKIKHEKFMNDTKDSILKDKRATAKLLRDARVLSSAGIKSSTSSNSSGKTSDTLVPVSIRCAKAEIDCLTATIEKLKLESEGNVRKHKLSERRYQDHLKELKKTIETNEIKVLSLQEERDVLWGFIEKNLYLLHDNGIKLPVNLKNYRIQYHQEYGTKHVGNSSIDSTGQKSNNISASADLYQFQSQRRGVTSRPRISESPNRKSYTSTVNSIVTNNPINKNEKLTDKRGGSIYVEEINNIQGLISNKVTSTYVVDGNNEKSDTLFDSDNTILKKEFSTVNSIFESEIDSKFEVTDYLRTSWARSSKSSRGSRYSLEDTQESPNCNELQNSVKDSSGSGINALSSSSTQELLVTELHNNSSIPDNGYGGYNNRDREIVINSLSHQAMRQEEILADGTTLIKYRNGTTKQVFPDGKSIVQFVNGDTKTTTKLFLPSTGMEELIVVYYYAQANTTHTTYADGLQVYEFPNGQVSTNNNRTVICKLDYTNHF